MAADRRPRATRPRPPPCRAPARPASAAPAGPAPRRRASRRSGPARSSRCSSRSPASTARRARTRSRSERTDDQRRDVDRPRTRSSRRSPSPPARTCSRSARPSVERLPSDPGDPRRVDHVALPDEVRVDVAERVALLAWQVGADRYLVDEDGMLFARIDDDAARGAAKLPVVDDQRAAAAGLAVATTLDPVILDAARRLGSLRPADLGTAATRSRSARRRAGLLDQRPTRSAGPRCSGSTRRRCARPT